MNTDNILILSWCDADEVINYGQILQGCAMMYVLRQLNSGSIVYISYLPRSVRGRFRWLRKHYSPKNGHLNAYIKTKKTLKKFIYQNAIQYYRVSNEKKLEKVSRNIDIMICGSDQIWHPQNYDKNYYLDFGKEEALRISYAASLPKSYVEPQFTKQMDLISKQLNRFDEISVREQSSVKLISQLSGKKVSHVLDPTYLVPVNIWTSLIEQINLPEKYLFVYVPNGMDDTMVKYINLLKHIIGIENVLFLVTRGENMCTLGTAIKFVSLGQFLYLIKNASFVFTSSFHAVVFSTIFHTEFLCYDVPNEKRGEDLRLMDLLQIFKLEDRIVQTKYDIEKVKPIEYLRVDQVIEKYKSKSLEYLKNILLKPHASSEVTEN